MMFFKTIELASATKNDWGKIKCSDEHVTFEVIGVWPCDPLNITIGTKFSADLEKQNFQRKVQYKIIDNILPTDADNFAVTNHLSRCEISHITLQKMIKEKTNLYEAFFTSEKGTPCFSSLNPEMLKSVHEAFKKAQKAIHLQKRFPFLNSNLCAEIDENHIDQVEEKPYTLTRYNKSAEALKAADSIAKFKKLNSKDAERVLAYAQHVIRNLFNTEKHYWFDIDYVAEKLIQSMKEHKNTWPANIDKLDAISAISQCTYNENNTSFVCLKEHYNEEEELATKIKDILKDDDLNIDLEHIADEIPIFLDAQQKQAVLSALSISTLICGLAGVGKTIVIKEIVRILSMLNIPFKVMAPTGKASVRVSEGLGNVTATTVHYAIASSKKSNEENKEVVIIDESSMLSPHLLLKLLREVNVKRLIIVGDHNQLPSIESGCLLKDLIRSEVFPVIELLEIHRQKEGSLIAQKSHEVIRGSAYEWSEINESIFSLSFSSNCLKEATNKVKLLYDAGETVQMIVMTNKSALDANMILQNVYNPSNGEEIERSNRAPWRLTDSVINLENYYENGQIMVCNGALGKILKLDTKKKKVSVKFENCSRTYNAGTNELGHSYCLTVHKYQGSEISCIVFCMDYVPNMSTKEMIYTAITRARHQCHIFAPQNIWKTGCQKNEGVRETRLAERLMEHNGKKSRYF